MTFYHTFSREAYFWVCGDCKYVFEILLLPAGDIENPIYWGSKKHIPFCPNCGNKDNVHRGNEVDMLDEDGYALINYSSGRTRKVVK